MNIEIDLSGQISEFSLTGKTKDDFITYVLEKVTEDFYRTWYDMAATSDLRQTKDEYTKSLYVFSVSPTVKGVKLDGWLPNAVEQGLEPFDLKPYFEQSKSGKVKYNKKGGWYLTIPFRHRIPGIQASSQAFSNVMPEAIYKTVKTLAVGQSLKSGMLPEQFKEERGVREKIVLTSKTFDEYVHKHSIYEGMQKAPKKHHGGYVTFRRAGQASDANSFIHTGIIARDFMNKAFTEFNASRMDNVTDLAVSNFLNNL